MKNKTTGILTLSSAQNYGAVLQCYSLCRYLNENFSKTEIIDFTPEFIYEAHKLKFLNTTSFVAFCKSIISFIIHFPLRLYKKVRFNRFRKYLSNYSQKRYLKVFNDDCYDQYIVGSDQVFNLELTRNEKAFFLPHIKDSNKKATYAASLGVNSLDGKQKDIFKKGLQSFNNLSFRENTGKELIKEIFPEKEVFQNIDSVFLTEKRDWEKLSRNRLFKKKYILVYTFKAFDLAYQIARHIDKDIDIVCISNGIRTKKGVINARAVGPEEFISLIRFAEHIVTDSFHGTSFSIIFNKEFTSIPYKGTESRFVDLLTSLSLENRIAYSLEDVTNAKIDYDKVNIKIKEAVQNSYKYFKKIYE